MQKYKVLCRALTAVLRKDAQYNIIIINIVSSSSNSSSSIYVSHRQTVESKHARGERFLINFRQDKTMYNFST